jgi:hypothetical protein
MIEPTTMDGTNPYYLDCPNGYDKTSSNMVGTTRHDTVDCCNQNGLDLVHNDVSVNSDIHNARRNSTKLHTQNKKKMEHRSNDRLGKQKI